MNSFTGIKYQIVDHNKGSKKVSHYGNTYIFKFPCSNQSDCTPYKLLFSPGYYRIELWGAYGGDGRYVNVPDIRKGSGGKGAYVSGKLAISGTQELFLFIGGRGEDQTDIYHNRTLGGYNGGGNGGLDLNDDSYPESSAGGGGATDLRLLCEQTFLGWKSRIIVAAGGGGATSTNVTNNKHKHYKAGDGGTINGVSTSSYAFGGTQTSGLFGYGQNGFDFGNDSYTLGGSSGGCGGGYYGGTVKECEEKEEVDSQETGGAGGSSFISGYDGCKAINYESTIDNITHSSKSYHYSHLYFDDGIMKKNGDEDFIDQFEESSFEKTQNGVARITILSSFDSLKIFCSYHKLIIIDFPLLVIFIVYCKPY